MPAETDPNLALPLTLTRSDILRDVIRIPLRTFNQQISKGEFPRHDFKAGVRRVWRRETILAWAQKGSN